MVALCNYKVFYTCNSPGRSALFFPAKRYDLGFFLTKSDLDIYDVSVVKRLQRFRSPQTAAQIDQINGKLHDG